MKDFAVQNGLAYTYRGALVTSKRSYQRKRRGLRRKGLSFNSFISIFTTTLILSTASYCSYLYLKNGTISSAPIGIQAAAPPALRKVTAAEFIGSLSARQKREMATSIHFIATKMLPYKVSLEEAHHIARVIVEESYKTNFDPLFITSVVFAESAFSKTAISRVGARGLMQLMPATAKYVSAQNQTDWKGIPALYTAEYNIKLGTKYLLYLAHAYQGDQTKSLLAYNWGPGNLNRFLASGKGRIPGESKAYVQKIGSYHEKWSRELNANRLKYEFGAMYHSIY
jgi:soluble lytic murein transglycosylase